MSILSESIADDASWLDIEDVESITNLSLDDVLRESRWEDEGVTEELLLSVGEGVLKDGRESSLSSSPSLYSYALECPVRSRLMDKESLLLLAHSHTQGNPTCIAVFDSLLVVGTSHGSVLFFSLLTDNLEGLVECKDNEAVSCLAFSQRGKVIGVGHCKGRVQLISTSNRRVEHISTNVVQEGRGILQVSFISTLCLLVLDSGGSVYEFRVKRRLRGKAEETRCVFSGCNGEVVHLLPLASLHLLILVSLTKVLIISTRHGGSVVCSLALKGSPEAPPVMDVLMESSNVFHLCLCRGSSISIHRFIISRLASTRRAHALQSTITVETENPLIMVSFHGHSLLTAIDSRETLYSIDIEKGTVVQGGASSQVQCIFATSDYKGLAYGGNVSAALRCMADNAAYNSYAKSGQTIFVLGPCTVYELTVMDERQQLESLYDRKEVIGAALYLLDMIKGRVRCRDPMFMSHVHLRLVECIRYLLDLTTHGIESGRISDLMNHYRRHIDVLLRTCVGAQLFDILYDEIYPRLEKDVLSKSILLELLDEYFLDGCFARPPPSLVADYLDNLINEGHFSQLQAAVVRIPIECIDLHKVMTTCRRNNLYDGVIYIMNRALNDFLSPLEEMLDTVAGICDRGDILSDDELQQTSQLMLYLHCCLAGAAYPIGVLPEEQAKTVPIQVYRCLTCVRGKDGTQKDRGTYPNMRLLLTFDAQQFLHVVATCADATLFTTEERRLQRLTELVGSLSLEINTPTVLSQFIRFVSNLVSTDRIITPAETVNQAIERLLSHSQLTPSEEHVVVEIMRYASCIDVERVLRLSKKPLRVIISSHIYRLQRRFIDLLDCYLTPPVQVDALFEIANGLFESELTTKEYSEVSAFIRQNAERLCELSPSLTASLLSSHLMQYMIDLRETTTPDSRKERRRRNGEMLLETFNIRSDRGEKTVTANEDVDEWLFEMAFEWASLEGGRSDTQLKSLLVYWLPLGSRRDLCLNAAASMRKTAASVLLLEARDLLPKAFALLLSQLDFCIQSADDNSILSSTDDILLFARSHPIEASKEGWLLTIFHRIVDAVREGQYEEMKERLVHTVERMLESGTDKASEMFECLLQYPSFVNSSLGDEYSLITSILSSCQYESSLLSSYCNMHNLENTANLKSLEALSHRRIDNVVFPLCVTCGGGLTMATYLYSCGHMQHQECWSTSTKSCPICFPPESHDDIMSTVELDGPRDTVVRMRNEVRVKKRRNIFQYWDDELSMCPNGLQD